MEQGYIKVLVIGILVLIVIYMILRRRTEKLRRARDERSRFRRNR